MSRSRNKYDPVKRGLDIASAATGLIVLSPVIGITALLVKRNLGSPVLFKQERPGKNGKVFTLYKFRSMLDVDEARGVIEDEDRLTAFGKILRSTSLDELPSMVNVLRGDMSVVGPRPLLVEYLSRYTSNQSRRHEVRPGITGLAQVRGRNAVSWERRFEFDVEYVDRRSFWLDAGILLATIRAVFARKGISQEGHVTMPRFRGSSDAS